MASKRVFRPSGKGFYEVTGVNEDTPVDATALGAQAFVYDFTYFVPEKLQTLIKENDGVLDLGGIEEYLKAFCRNYCFQLEESPSTGRWHVQGRFKTKKIIRLGTLIKKMKNDEMCPIWPCHISRTAVVNHQSPAFYRYPMKDTTRVAGYKPVADQDIEEDPQDLEILEDVVELNSWQRYAFEISQKYQEPEWKRKVLWFFCKKGNTGKTTFKTWMRFHKKAVVIPNCDKYETIMNIVLQKETSPCYIFDIPRSMGNRNKQIKHIYSAIETIKDGYAYDTRYKFREKVMRVRPLVIVLANFIPEMKELSRDRFHVVKITKCNGEISYEVMETKKEKKIAKIFDSPNPSPKRTVKVKVND